MQEPLLFARLWLGEAWEKGFVHVLGHECPHVFRGLRCGESFEEVFQVGLVLDLIGLGGFNQGKEHGAGVGTFGGSGPIVYGRLDQELRDRYLPTKEASWFASNKPSQYKEILLLAAKEVLGLIERIKDHPSASQLPAFALLVRLAEEQIVKNGEEVVVHVNQETNGSAMTNPHDPDAHYNEHYDKLGYKADFSEACGKDKDTPHPKIFTQVSVHPANTSDKTTLLDTVGALEDKGLMPQTLLADNGYDSDDNQQGCVDLAVELVCPPSGTPADGFNLLQAKMVNYFRVGVTPTLK